MNQFSKTIFDYLKHSFYFNQKQQWNALALKAMPNNASILDIGCGIGRFIEQDPKRIHGIDHSEKSVTVCRNKGLSVTQADVTRLPFEDASFEGVHCAHVIEHLIPTQAHELLKEIDRILKNKGVFCLQTPLLYDGFYNDLTHIKPYNPKAILHYINTNAGSQRTLNDLNGKYTLLKLRYRRQPLFYSWSAETPKLLRIISNLLLRFGITRLKKTGYMLIVEKNA
jgi:ubiquinone/menaquinone biosynthesis C-methylase UbiE